ncbi:flagellar basal body-associated FliL family protein [Telmatospirillum sp.]|uniref:flagellar basal body-associated FliL family protein n=1 Tax=Telmatospirillum sp. TaxID=2079197 RepID=UPI002846256A|nr:flagellar basal body-associated FliL family protein [Telmatospirillum sp.]MDR3438530.1 flagellar basal body-associated FliL family protein [Telmatospirillum sp.]
MAEDLEEDFEEGEASDEMEAAPVRQGSSSKKKKLILIVVAILAVVGVAAGLYFAGFLDPLLHATKSEKKVEEEKPKEVHAAVFYDLPEILVNLNSAGRKQNFLKIRVSLELDSPLDVSKVESVMPRIIDNFQVYLRELRIEDLQGSAGMLRLREELLTRVNNAVKPAKVNDVLFKEMLVQ